MKRKGLERIDHIKEHITHILTATQGKSREQFDEDWILQAAIVRFIEIIGEASKYVPDDIKLKHPEIPWRAIAGMRDIAAHDYSDINISEIWNIVQKDIPILKAQIDAIEY